MKNQNNPILTAKNIYKSYTIGHRNSQILRGVNLQIQRGEFVAIMGASGSGKSTLMHILGLLDIPDKGQVLFENQDIFNLNSKKQNRIRNHDFGFVFQFYHLLPELSVMENILLPAMVGSSMWNWLTITHKAKSRARDLIDLIGLNDQVNQKPDTLSGGERQRTAIARALMQKPRLLLADEPTGNLDSATGKAILDILTKLNQNGQTIIMVTHDEAVAELADRKLHLRDGII